MSREGWDKLKSGDKDGAEAVFRAALDKDPKDVSSLHGLGRIALATRQFEYAASLLSQANRLAPEVEPLAFDLIQALSGEVVNKPEDALRHYNLGLGLLAAGDIENARDALLGALLADPGHVQSRWLVNRILPRVYLSKSEISQWRKRVFTAVTALEATVYPQSPEEAERHLQGILTRSNFELAYQAEDDRPLQEAYGRLLTRIVNVWRPQFAKPPATEPIGKREDKRIRVGFASSYFTSHTIALMFGGFIRHLDRSRFLVHGYLTNGLPDSSTKVVAGLCHVFRDLRGALDEAAQAIHADRLDVLIYPDIGMDARGQILAAMKLAPLQVTGMGHPVTTGLPSIDYFLTSDLMEPEGDEAHYCEKLVRLPNTSFTYQPTPTPQTKGRADFGLPTDGPLFLCCQALQKYLPQFDVLFPAIARKCRGTARFVFIKHRTRHIDNRRFQARIEQAFRAQGLDPARHAFFLRWQDWPDYLQLNGVCDVFLDSVGWSGGNTSMEALSRLLPIVTLPANLMRGRHAYSMLKVLGLERCIARDLEDYVAIAAKLGEDADFNRGVRDAIRTGHDKLYNDMAPIRALEAFLEERVRAGQ